MAKKTDFPAVPETASQVDADATYGIRVSEPVLAGRRKLAVSLEHEVSGAFLKVNWGKVTYVRKITG